MKGRAPGRLRHITELDGIRGLAAVAVFFHHFCLTEAPAATVTAWPLPIQLLWVVSSHADSGVDIFFVLSGFLITSILLEERNSQRYYQDFYWKRALRILPLYFLCLLGVLLFFHNSGRFVLLSAIFLANFAEILHVHGLGPYWTLAIEEQFYLLWPTVVRKRNVDTLMRWSIGLGLASLALRFLFAAFGHHNYYVSFLRCDGLAFGAGLACFYRRNGQAPARQPATLLLSVTFLLGACLPYLEHYLPTVALGAALYQTSIVLMTGGGIGLVIVHSGASVLAIFRSRLMVFFGLISYAFYMFHLYVIWSWDGLRGALRTGDANGFWLRLAGCLTATVLLAVVSRYAVELPAMRLRKYVLSHPRGKVAEAVPLPLARMD